MPNIDLKKYENFVEKVTSEESNDWAYTHARLHELNDKVNISLLMTGGIGLSSETGELNEIIKMKISDLPVLTNDTDNVIEFNNSLESERKFEKKRSFWELLKIK